jgi:hypothetical protein
MCRVDENWRYQKAAGCRADTSKWRKGCVRIEAVLARMVPTAKTEPLLVLGLLLVLGYSLCISLDWRLIMQDDCALSSGSDDELFALMFGDDDL